MLTTLDKVKALLGITDNSKDTLLTDFIAQITSFVQTACGGRIFEVADYEEIYDYPDGVILFLKQYPIDPTDFTLSYRTGTISSPTWVAYSADDFLIYSKEGYVRFVSAYGGNSFDTANKFKGLKVEYTAGYLIDWTDEYDPTKHNLPADLTAVAGQLCVKMYNKKSSSGISSESTEGQSINYGSITDSDLSSEQKTILGSYMRYAIC